MEDEWLNGLRYLSVELRREGTDRGFEDPFIRQIHRYIFIDMIVAKTYHFY